MKKRRRTNYLAKCGAFSPAKAESFCEFVRTTLLHTQEFSLRFSQSLNYLKEKSQGQIRGNNLLRPGRSSVQKSGLQWSQAGGNDRQIECFSSEGGQFCKDKRKCLINALLHRARQEV